MFEILRFSLIVGIVSTIALDLFALIIRYTIGFPSTDWGMVGRWIFGVLDGQFFLNQANKLSPTLLEKIMGWGFHYVVGITYALLLIVVSGKSYIHQPTVFPAILIGIILSSLAGLFILTPTMGGGVLASKMTNQVSVIIYVIIAHSVFAATLYLTSILNTKI